MARPVIPAVAIPRYCGWRSRYSGANPGLDLVRRIVVAHGGEITFNPNPGETRFVVSLPVKGQNVEEGRFS